MNTIQSATEPLGFRETLRVLWKIFFDTRSLAPRGRLPEARPDLAAFLAPGGKARFIWFGHSTFLLNLDGQVILVDPVFSPAASPVPFFSRRFQPPVLGLADLPRVDAVVISHDHYDHLDRQSVAFFRDRETVFIVPRGVGEIVRRFGIPGERVTELDWYGSATRNGVTYTAAPAQHFSGRSFRGRNRTLWASWVLQGREERVFYSGDSGYGGHFAEIGQRFGPFDLAFLENGQYDRRWPVVHMQPEQTVQAALDLRAKAFVPVHWGMFVISLHPWDEPVRRSAALARERGVPLLAPLLGEVASASMAGACVPWWESAPAAGASQQVLAGACGEARP